MLNRVVRVRLVEKVYLKKKKCVLVIENTAYTLEEECDQL